MNPLVKYVVTQAVKKEVIQGFSHKHKITEFYKILIRAARKEFYEDNRPTLSAFLSECHEQAFEEVWEEK